MVFGPTGNRKMEICCDESPTEMLWTDYHSVAKFWKSSREMFQTEMTYPAVNECTFCIDRLAVPWALVTLTAFFGLCSVLTLCRSCHKNFRVIVAIGRMGCQCWRWTKRKTAYTRARTREKSRNKRERSTRERFTPYGHRGRTEIHCVFNQPAILTLWRARQSDAMMIRDDKETIEERKQLGAGNVAKGDN
ncbi:unnamed protein product [Meloidogyne enterolobii]|uniref:Uncharacterized protein n=1 Tax=Meloidogyne enterolobii TaxID=390850 RepID=A0ACB0ZWR6_MELEN